MLEKQNQKPGSRDMQRKIQDLTSLLEVTRLLSSDMSLQSILETMFRTTTHIMNCDRYSLFIYDEEKNELYSKIALGSEQEEIRFPAHKGIAGDVFQTGEPVNIKDCYADRRFNPQVDVKTGYKTNTLLCIPVTSFDGRRIGVIQVLNKRQGVFTPYDEYLLGLLASHLGVAVQRAFLMENYLEKQKLENEMNMAQAIQASLTPGRAPVFHGFDISCFSRQCETTGGDYLDFVPMTRNRLAVVIGDVTGHGLGASLLMLVARSTFRVLVENGLDLPRLAARMNRRILQDFSGERSMTFFYGVLDNENNAFNYINCGHDEPLWYHAQTATITFLAQCGLALGMLPGTTYEKARLLRPAKNDILVFYTDGITEAMNPEKELFGTARLEAVIKKNASENAATLQKRIRQSVSRFMQNGSRQDDMSLIIIKVG
jgi:sigma-B regulation protein RsbU (phosphoserine phosphatase)